MCVRAVRTTDVLVKVISFVFCFFVDRTRKASITTGVVERTEALRTDAVDRLSPLNSAANQFISFQGINDPNTELERFVDMDVDTTAQLLRASEIAPETAAAAMYSNVGTNVMASARRHTVGPGDVEHEQALAHPAPINFKFGATDTGPPDCRLPINLPMLQNQPLHNFTIKNQHLLKPPIVMEASECEHQSFTILNWISIDFLGRAFFQPFQVHLDGVHRTVERIYKFTIQHLEAADSQQSMERLQHQKIFALVLKLCKQHVWKIYQSVWSVATNQMMKSKGTFWQTKKQTEPK